MAFNFDPKSIFNAYPIVKNGQGVPGIETARKLFAPKRDIPTTAGGDPKLLLPEVLNQVDPQALSQVLPNMYKQFMQIRNLMNSFSTNNFNSSGNPNTDNSYVATSIIDVFTGAMTIVANKITYNKTLEILFNTLSNNAYKDIAVDYQNIVLNSIMKLMKLALEHGETNIPVPPIPTIVYGTIIPSPIVNSYNDIPDFYIQQYYTIENDPYPGYIQYQGQDGDYIYIKRTKNDPPYDSAQTEVFTQAQYDFANEILPYFINNKLTIAVLNSLLIKYCTLVLNNTSEKTMGKNSQKNILALLSQFAAIAATISQNTQLSQLPQSVLNVQSMSKTLDNHKMNIGKLKMLLSIAKTATIPASLIPPELNAISSILSSKSLNVSSIKSQINKIIG